MAEGKSCFEIVVRPLFFQRRRSKLAPLQAVDDAARLKLALVLGEFKGSEAAASGRKVWIRHMPDAPLFIDAKPWQRIERVYASLFEARGAAS